MIVIFDLDYTLLDLEKFKEGWAEALGLSKDEFNRSYQKNFKDQNINYSADRHLEILDKSQDQQVKEAIEDFLKIIDCYLLPEADELLEKLSSGNRLIMVSRGDEQWQKTKLVNLNIHKYFKPDDIIFVSGDKNQRLGFLSGAKEKIVIINDNAREGLAMREFLKNSRLYIVDGPYSRNIEHQEKIYTLEKLNRLFI